MEFTQKIKVEIDTEPLENAARDIAEDLAEAQQSLYRSEYIDYRWPANKSEDYHTIHHGGLMAVLDVGMSLMQEAAMPVITKLEKKWAWDPDRTYQSTDIVKGILELRDNEGVPQCSPMYQAIEDLLRQRGWTRDKDQKWAPRGA